MKIHFILFGILLNISLLAQNGEGNDALRLKADELAHRFIIVDGHVDLPYRLRVKNFRLTKEFIGIPVETNEGDFDYVRAKKGGLTSPFMSIYIPSSYQVDGGAKELADSLIDMVNGIVAAHPEKFGQGLSPDQVKKNFKAGKISLPMGMENAAPFLALSDVAYFHKQGIRYATLTHAKDNQICDSSYDTTRTWNGLSPYGREVVLEMNKQGIMVDISHVSDAAFYQTIGITKAPVIASHSSCRQFTPGFQRNMDDFMIESLGRNNGVILINFGSDFLDGQVTKNRDELRDKMRLMLEEKGIKEDDEAAKPYIDAFKPCNEKPLFADVELVADHIDHVVKLAGIDHVGFGSDFDGVGIHYFTKLKDVAAYPNLIFELLKRGYTEEDIEKICYKNLFRAWREVERVAAEMQKNNLWYSLEVSLSLN
ncbi:MAG: dipeptidase [Saprospiraceae bacterium]